MILSNKAILPILWEGFPGHANLLPAFDTQHADLGSAFVKKPIFGREGHNVTIVGPGLFDTAAGRLRQRRLSSGRPTSRCRCSTATTRSSARG